MRSHPRPLPFGLPENLTSINEKGARRLMRKTALHSVLAIAIALVATSAASSAVLVNAPAPDFALRSLDGSALRLSEFRSEVVLLSFVSQGCGRCRASMPFLQELRNLHQADGLQVLVVDIDGNPESAEKLMGKMQLTFPILLDSEQAVSRLYDLNQLPLTLLIDREGEVVLLEKGFQDPGVANIRAGLDRLLAD
jgi:peroxiredoxin